MQSLKYVTLGDRTSVVLSQVNDLLSGEISIGESICSIDDLVDFKQYFYDFHGEGSQEYLIIKEFLNLVRMIKRSIRLQKESESQKIQSWIDKYPIRFEYVKRLENLIHKKEKL